MKSKHNRKKLVKIVVLGGVVTITAKSAGVEVEIIDQDADEYQLLSASREITP